MSGYKTGLSQSTSMRQEMKVNPRLYQAMDLLYMPLLDLQQHLQQELLINPFLELVPEDEDSAEGEEAIEVATPEEQKADNTDEMDWQKILEDGFETGGRKEEFEEREYIEPVTVMARDLTDHLRDQVQMLELDPRQEFLADEFVGNINEDGYLGCELGDILTGVNSAVRKAAEAVGRDDAELPWFTIEEVEAMLPIIQQLDPPGVGARNLRECLLLQLAMEDKAGSVAYALVRDGFDELIGHRWSELAKRFGIPVSEVQDVADQIAKLDPKPGLKFAPDNEHYIIPDLVVDKVDGRYVVYLNDGNLPRLKLSRTYQDIARDKKKYDAESKDFIANKMNSAHWMIQAIEQRRQTMLKVMNYIVERQRDYFEKGVQYLKPLTLREVAEVIGMHESTVSRVTNEKFVQTPRGVLPLKFFFSSGLSTTGGEDVSARGIKDQIQKLVEGEDPKNPLTDQAIVAILQD
ncbi:MAG: RNA polymerase factor sigma-54, partial [Gemmatimonadaceae bacterium]|nr:RNA polymerase factor sigma-54 [Gemmatimonadaceae bacterium]